MPGRRLGRGQPNPPVVLHGKLVPPGPLLDASTPAGVSGSTAGITTASFTPPAGALILALVGSDRDAGADNGLQTITDSLGGTWTRDARSNTHLEAAVSRRTSATSGAAMTVTSTGPFAFEHGLKVLVITAADPTTPVLTTQANSGLATNAPTVTLTTQADNSLVVGVASAGPGTYTAVSGTTLLYTWTLAGNEGGWAARLTGNKTPPGAVTLASNETSSSDWDAVAVEVQAPVAAAAPAWEPVLVSQYAGIF